MLLTIVSCSKKIPDKKIIMDFKSSLLINSFSNEKIIERFILLDSKGLKNKELSESLNLQLNYLRKQFNNCKKNSVIDYVSAKKNNTKGFFEIDEKDLRKSYFLICNDSIYFPFKISNNKIQSFSTITKGKKRFFLDYN